MGLLLPWLLQLRGTCLAVLADGAAVDDDVLDQHLACLAFVALRVQLDPARITLEGEAAVVFFGLARLVAGPAALGALVSWLDALTPAFVAVVFGVDSLAEAVDVVVLREGTRAFPSTGVAVDVVADGLSERRQTWVTVQARPARHAV